MKTPFAMILLSAVLLAGCASKFNPLNWFGGSREETLKEVEIPTKAADLRKLVAQVTSLKIEKNAGGAIIHAVGLPPTQGYWDAALVPEFDKLPINGVLTFTLRIQQPLGFEKMSTPHSREVNVGYFISNHTLEGVKTIRVLGAQNARSVRR
ncbi:MAG TPA: hypothetical protein DD729_11070 [Rhodobacteraceae bacterium]|nr:hypothetical protein [Paracoccaceae bacterium]